MIASRGMDLKSTTPLTNKKINTISPKKKEVLTSEKTDHLFLTNHYPKPFSFNSDVANVFDDMINRSVPLYQEVLNCLAFWTGRFYQPGTTIYDIGCPTGSALTAILKNTNHQIHYMGIDNSKAMIDRAADKLTEINSNHDITFSCQDAVNTEYNNASIVILNYTLQFISVNKRKTLLTKIYQSLLPNGILFLSDKVRSNCPEFQEIITHDYESFKKSQGYSQTEIERKKEALENVLVCLSFNEELELLKEAGFQVFEPVLKWNNFTTFVALKR